MYTRKDMREMRKLANRSSRDRWRLINSAGRQVKRGREEVGESYII